MSVNKADFELFEQQFIELVGEFRTLTISESKLREVLRNEAARAEAAESARDASIRAAADARAAAAAASTGAAHASTLLAASQDELVGVKIQLDFVDRQRALLEEKCAELTETLNEKENELEKLRPVQSAHSNLQRQYVDLQKRIQNATNEARSEASRLENELRRVERCASAGSEVRERARLAAAAHARERRLAAAELQHVTSELRAAYAHAAHLGVQVVELQYQISNIKQETSRKNTIDPSSETLAEVRAALEAERAGTARLEKALASALSDNALFAAQLHTIDNDAVDVFAPSSPNKSTNICPIDSFLAE